MQEVARAMSRSSLNDMRCNYCGWDENSPGQVTCSRCGSPLQSGGEHVYTTYNSPTPYQGGEAKKTRVFHGMPQSSDQQYSESTPPRPTVIQHEGMGGMSSHQPITCPDCDYELRDDYDYCPRCGKVLREQDSLQQVKARGVNRLVLEPNVCEKCGKEVPAEFRYCPYCGGRIELKTIPVGRKHKKVEKPQPHFKLTTIYEDDEQQENLVHEFEGEQVFLNRDNTDPQNPTITSKNQALISYEDGCWMIENRSELASTFVAASHKIILQPGDIIMLGDRCFTFEPEQVKDSEQKSEEE